MNARNALQVNATVEQLEFESASPTIKKWLTHILADITLTEQERHAARVLLAKANEKDKAIKEAKSTTMH